MFGVSAAGLPARGGVLTGAVTVQITTSEVPPHERFELWSSETSRLFAPLTTGPVTRQEFWARARARELGSVQVAHLAAAPHAVRRTPRAIAGDDPEVFWLLQLLQGSTVVTQQDRTAVLRPGDLTIYDSSRPHAVVNSGPFEVAVFQIPRSLLRLPDEVVATLTATRIAGDEGPGALVAPFLRGLAGGLAAGTLPERGDDLGAALLHLVDAIVAPRVAPDEPPAPASSPATLVAAKRYIERRLSDPALSPDEVARAVFVSRRALYGLFEQEGLGVAEWIRHRRLERCRRDLRDPALSELTIARIAAEHGFRNAEHFSRAFRAAYGCSPGAYRRGEG